MGPADADRIRKALQVGLLLATVPRCGRDNQMAGAVVVGGPTCHFGGLDRIRPWPVGTALVAVHNWTFILGPGLICGVNTFVMAYALYRSKLVARFIPVLGLIGGPLVFAANVALMFGVPRHDLGVLIVPVFAWEICLTIFLITKGFRSTATTAGAPSEAQYPQLTAA